jgi:hypothetical protein
MIAVLSTELATYVHKLRVVAEGPSRPQSDSTAAPSGDSRESETEGLERMKAMAEAGTCEYKSNTFLCTDYRKIEFAFN